MAITVTVDAVDRTADVYRAGPEGSVRFSMAGSSWYAEFTLYDQLGTSGAYRPSLGEEVLIEENGTDVFHGRIDKISESAAPESQSGLDGTHSRVRCKAFSAVVDQVVVNEDYAGIPDLIVANSSVANPTTITTNQPHGLVTNDRVRIEGHMSSTPALDGDYAVTVTSHSTFTIPVNVSAAGGGGSVRKIYKVKSIVSDLRTTYLDDYGITLDGSMTDGPDIEAPTFKDASLRQIFDHLALQTGRLWRITPTDELQFFDPGEKTANYDLTAANKLSKGPISWERSFDNYVNDVYLRYGPDAMEARTDTFTGDGSTNLYALTYTPVLVNGILLSAGYVTEGGVFYALGALSDIVSSSVANPSTITTTHPHGFQTGDSVVIQGHAGSTPSINSTHTVTVTGVYSFTIPVNVTVAGAGGSCYNPAITWLYYPTLNSLVRVGSLGNEVSASLVYQVQFPQTVHVSDSAGIAANGAYSALFERPDLKDAHQAEDYADALLRNSLETPMTVTLSTRNGFPGMPGDQLTLTFSDRTITGTHTIRDVSARDVTLSGTFEYTLTCQAGDEVRTDYSDRFKSALLSGGSRGSGTITGGVAISPGGFVSGRVQAERVVIRDPSSAVLEMRIQRDAPDAEELESIELTTTSSTFTLSDVFRDSDGEASATLLQISRSTGETTFATGLTHQQVNNCARFTPLSFSLADTAIQVLGDNAPSGSSGFIFIEDVTNAVYGIFYLRGGNAQVSTIAASAGWSTTASTGSSRNVYWDAGDSRYELENNSGGTVSFRIFHIGLLN